MLHTPFVKYMKSSATVWFSTLVIALRAKRVTTSEDNKTCDKFVSGSEKSKMDDHMLLKEKREQRKIAAFWGLFIGDAIAMPVHWYYDPDDIYRDYGGWLTSYKAPNKEHPSSILSLSDVDGSGRSGFLTTSKPVIGNIILHDKLRYWTNGGSSVHYHQGMSSGDNTLNVLTALETMKTMQKFDPKAELSPKELRARVMENYVRFLTTPGSHNDTYAESFHRSFFKDWSRLDDPPVNGNDILRFCERRWDAVSTNRSEDGQIAVVGSLVLAIPWIIHYSHLSIEECVENTSEAVRLTHPAPSLMPYIAIYTQVLHSVINGANVSDVAKERLNSNELGGSGKQKRILKYIEYALSFSRGSEDELRIYQEAVLSLGSACYIKGSMCSLLLLAIGFHDDFANGVFTNANCGGENAHRGAALGAILGANTINTGREIPKNLKIGLNSARSFIEQIVKHTL